MDTLTDIAAVLLALVAGATFALMIWAARQVDGRAHAPHLPRLHLPHVHLPHAHLRRRA